MKRLLTCASWALLALLPARTASAFCGFYVAKADSKLFNKASRVALVRDENRTVLTMANDYRGDPKEFALVVPVPTFIERGQIHVADPAVLDHLDAYSAPRLVEYFDEDPCQRRVFEEKMARMAAPMAAAPSNRDAQRSRGVTVEARYTVGEYDILILSAKESSGLEAWLQENGYRVPAGASRVLASYVRQGNRFFVAKVNLAQQSRLGFSYLRPLQVAFESPKFMLPIRLGTVNADGPQELFVYALTRKGRVETANYRTVRLPTGMDIPVYVKDRFPDFYRAMFGEQTRREDMRAVFLEYAWDMGWCDPCAAEPLSREELRQLGVFWLDEGPIPMGRVRPFPVPNGGPVDVFLTRLHVRYDGERFPEDLVFQQTPDRTNFQGRYVLRHAWAGPAQCAEGERYRAEVEQRQEREATTLASLTGWETAAIRRHMELPARANDGARRWWQSLWK
jgi:hypothetical protein